MDEETKKTVLSLARRKASGTVGGTLALLQILKHMESPARQALLKNLSESSPALAGDLARHFLNFDDLVHIQERGFPLFLKKIDHRDLALALKGAPRPVAEKFLKNMSRRQAEILVEEIRLLGATRVRDIEAARARIVELARALETTREITLIRPGIDEFYE